MVITDEYRKVMQEMHQNPEFGANELDPRTPSLIEGYCREINSYDLLDYGCGKGKLAKALRFPIKEYDPAIPGKDTLPEPADLVWCTDVLEHIEPDCLDDVLKDLQRVVKKIGLFGIHLHEARKTLPDGRNAHLIIKDPIWWCNKLGEYFDLAYQQVQSHSLFVRVQPQASRTFDQAEITMSVVDITPYQMEEFGEFDPHPCFPAHIPYSTTFIKRRMEFPLVEPKDERIAVVAYGPSLKDEWERLRDYKTIISTSGAHSFLLDRGIVPTIHLEIDWKKHKAGFTSQPHPGIQYIISAVCHPDVIDNVWQYNSHLIFVNHGPKVPYPEGVELLNAHFDVGQAAILVAAKLGYKKQDLFGYDYCFAGPDLTRHAGPHRGKQHTPFLAKVGNKTWFCSKTMFAGIMCFEKLLRDNPDLDIQLYSDSLLMAFLEHRFNHPISGDSQVIGEINFTHGWDREERLNGESPL